MQSAAVASSVYVAIRLVLDLMWGGNRWKQGDWLINNKAVLVRRGPVGSVLIDLADLLGISPLMTTGAVQGSLVLLLMLATGYILSRLPENRTHLLLVLSPAFFFVFWPADPQGSLRKEIIAYAAIAVLIASRERGSTLLYSAACTLFVAACIAHEANILFLPMFVTVAFLIAQDSAAKIVRGVILGLTLVGAFASLVYALTHLSVPDSRTVCAPLLERGLRSEMCGGAIEWLEHDVAYGMSKVLGRMPNWKPSISLFVAYPFALVPIAYFVTMVDRCRFSAGCCLALGVPFVPLYLVAKDWGRWMNFHVTSAVFFLVYLLLSRRVTLVRDADPRALKTLIVLAILWSPRHTEGIVEGGMVRECITLLYILASE